jgi:hypothetical protein
LDQQLLFTQPETRVLIERQQRGNTVRPPSALGYRPPAPAPVAWLPPAARSTPPLASPVAMDEPARRSPSSALGNDGPFPRPLPIATYLPFGAPSCSLSATPPVAVSDLPALPRRQPGPGAA